MMQNYHVLLLSYSGGEEEAEQLSELLFQALCKLKQIV